MNETHATKYLVGLPTETVGGTSERTRRLLAEMGVDLRSLNFIKILGEAGKSSASSLLANLLTRASIRVGTLFLTPRREPRTAIAIDGEAPSHADFAEAVTAAWSAARSTELDAPTYEEILLAAALCLFTRANCRTAILILPTNARLSATSALPSPKLCLVTTTSEAVAQTLLPLIDTNGELVSAPQAPSVYHLLTERAAFLRCRHNSPIRTEIGETAVRGGSLCFDYRGESFSLPTLAHFQKNNALAVIEAYRALVRQGHRLGRAHLDAAFAAFAPALSFRFFSLSPAWVIDAADTPMRLAALADTVDGLPELFGDPLTLWCEPSLEADVRAAFGNRAPVVECIEPSALRRALKKTPPPRSTPLLVVGTKPFAAEALRALESFFLYA